MTTETPLTENTTGIESDITPDTTSPAPIEVSTHEPEGHSITEEYLKDNFLTAYFINSERTDIEIMTTTKDKKQVITTIIPFDKNDIKYQALSKYMNIDQLHESTYQKVKQERKQFEDTVLRIAKKDGIVMDSAKIDTKFYPKVVDALFNDKENPDHLFALKLAVFEIQGVKDSDKEDVKKKLRQSKNKIDVLAAVCEILA
tara:strand:+ start:563 stop:1165 length:603 start_codon:yes stop_codon:yes gene_type:complete